MIENPARWAPPYAEAGAYNVTFHAEATDDPVAVARDIRAAGAKAGLSVKPGTPIEPYLKILKSFDTLLIMSVEPGFGGQSFMPEVLSKARAVRKLVDSGELKLVIEIDGGIAESTIEQAAVAGIDCFVAGSAVYGAEIPARPWSRCAVRRPRHPSTFEYESRGRDAAGDRAGRTGQGWHLSEPAGGRGDPGQRQRGRRSRRD